MASLCIQKLAPDILKYTDDWKKTPSSGKPEVVLKCISVLEGLMKSVPDDKSINYHKSIVLA